MTALLKTCEISMAGTGMWENIGACFFCSELQSYKMAVVSNSSNFCKSLMVSLYWNCCWNIAQRWLFKSSMAIKALQCLIIFHATSSYYENSGISHGGLLPIYTMEWVGSILLTKDVYHPRSYSPANIPGPSIFCFVKTRKVEKGPVAT